MILADELYETDPDETDDLIKIVALFSCKAADTFVAHFNETIQTLLSKIVNFTADYASNSFIDLLELWEDLTDALNRQQKANLPIP